MREGIYADMHNHTTASDGDLSPERLIQRIKSLGIAVVGVTDHDTGKGLERAIAEGQKIGVQVLPGVEMSVRFKEKFFTGTLHLLCYFPSEMIKNERFIKSFNRTLGKGRGEHLVRARVSEINRFFGPQLCHQGDCIESGHHTAAIEPVKIPILKRELTFEDVASYSSAVTRRHFALALTEKHGIDNPDIVNQIIGNDSPAYLPSGVDLESVNQFQEEFSLMMVLAHPAAGSFPGGGHYKEVHPPVETVERLFPRFIDAGIRGIEINYPGHIESHRAILRQWAAKYDLVATGGSDCHDEFVRPPGVEGISREEFEKFDSVIKSP